MVRVALLLLIAAGLVIFTLQNLTPMALVVVGVKTQALPLAVWVLGAIAAGAFTTVLVTSFPGSSRSSTVGDRASYGRAADAAARTGRAPWGAETKRTSTQASRPKGSAGFTAAGSSRRNVDDWEAPESDDWDDWGSSQEPAQYRSSPSPATKTEIRDRADDDWANWEGYEKASPRDSERRSPENPAPRRTEFESQQPPKSSQRSGSTYSYSYREPQDSAPRRKTNEVYDAEYRVLIPPHNPTPEPPAPTPAPAPAEPKSDPSINTTADEDDWDLGDLLDDFEDKTDRPK
jgi:hypothetical protein